MAFMYNYISNKQYKVCYYISVVCLTLSNIAYASADSANSLALLIVGRIFLGAGGARIAIWDLDADLAAEKAASLGGGCFALPVNVADWSNVEAACDETFPNLGASISWSIVLALQARTRLSKIIRWIISQRLLQSI